MAHELSMRGDNTAEMAYVGDLPWHGLGQKLEPGAGMDVWLEAAGMNWKIEKSIVRYVRAGLTSGEGEIGPAYSSFSDMVVLHRGDNGLPLSVMAKDYKIVQPQEVLEFFRNLCDAHGFKLETAGTLFGGKRFWAMASIGEESEILDPKDKVKGNLLLSTSCDGTLSTTGRFVATRVVCNNTLGMAHSEKGGTVVKKRHKAVFNPEDMQDKLGIGTPKEDFKAFIDRMRDLASLAMNDKTMISATVELFRPGILASGDAQKIDAAVRSKAIARVLDIGIRGNRSLGGGLGGVAGTAWGWLNAVTQYIDHEGRAHTSDGRIDAAWFGTGAKIKGQAWDMANDLYAEANGLALADSFQG